MWCLTSPHKFYTNQHAAYTHMFCVDLNSRLESANKHRPTVVSENDGNGNACGLGHAMACVRYHNRHFFFAFVAHDGERSQTHQRLATMTLVWTILGMLSDENHSPIGIGIDISANQLLVHFLGHVLIKLWRRLAADVGTIDLKKRGRAVEGLAFQRVCVYMRT